MVAYNFINIAKSKRENKSDLVDYLWSVKWNFFQTIVAKKLPDPNKKIYHFPQIWFTAKIRRVTDFVDLQQTLSRRGSYICNYVLAYVGFSNGNLWN